MFEYFRESLCNKLLLLYPFIFIDLILLIFRFAAWEKASFYLRTVHCRISNHTKELRKILSMIALIIASSYFAHNLILLRSLRILRLSPFDDCFGSSFVRRFCMPLHISIIVGSGTSKRSMILLEYRLKSSQTG